ncbi:MAG: M3 family metallopeptidase [bacterium]
MKSKILFIVLAVISISFSYQAQENKSDNPFFKEWKTPFQTAPFNEIKEEHYMPAFEEGMKIQKQEVDVIINNPEAPTFENTITAFEKSGELLNKVSNIFYGLLGVATTEGIQKIAEEIAPVFAKHSDDINLNEKLFARVKALYDKKESLNLNQEQKYLLEKYYKDFVKSGANLSEADKEKFRKINEELSTLSLQFGQNVLKETNAFELVIDNEKDLSGLPESAVAAAKETATKKGYENKWVFTLHAPSRAPFMTYCDNRALREKLSKASLNRANHDNENDNKNVIQKIVSLRIQRANLLGYKSHADFTLDEYMAQNPQRVFDFLLNLWKPALEKTKSEIAELQQLSDSEGNNFKLEQWDISYYSEKLKMAKYSFDDETLRPYFQFDTVLKGLLNVINNLFGLQLVERTDIPVYEKDVKAFEVTEADGKHLGVIYMDYFPRDNKRAGAWCGAFREQSNMDGKFITPIILNAGNMTKPTADKPALLTLDEVKTLFHEFGHALHNILSNITYPSFAGTNVAWDFVELPSQLLENWVTQPEVLKTFAIHYQTGEVIPEELVEKLNRAELFGKGRETVVTYIYPSLLDMELHTLSQDVTIDVPAFEKNIKNKYGLLPELGCPYPTTINSHCFNGGYSSGYYSYIWAEVLDADAFEAFKENGIFDKETAASFRKNVLEKGGSDVPLELYKKFRGREPKVDALLLRRGLK